MYKTHLKILPTSEDSEWTIFRLIGKLIIGIIKNNIQ